MNVGTLCVQMETSMQQLLCTVMELCCSFEEKLEIESAYGCMISGSQVGRITVSLKLLEAFIIFRQTLILCMNCFSN